MGRAGWMVSVTVSVRGQKECMELHIAVDRWEVIGQLIGQGLHTGLQRQPFGRILYTEISICTQYIVH